MSAGLGLGLGIAYVDNFAFDGEVSPILVVLLALAATGALAFVWQRQALPAAGICWALIPGTHAIKYVLGLPDTLHPNTAASILLVAAFSAAICLLGFGAGLLLRSIVGAKR